jgi:BirA family transcriptional regulator, biotin operon repressor / biotin---[acetyl-CoA-carboxylase] ligase
MIISDAPVIWFDQIDSTNAEAARRAGAGEHAPLWIEAGAQTAGRGRRGRAWLSAPGNVFLTYLGHADRAPADLALLGFAAAVAVADVVDALIGSPATRLKWPNDVLIGGAKLSGILLESGSAAPPKAISDQVDAGWSGEIATKKESRAPIRSHRIGLGSKAGLWFALGVGVNCVSPPEDTDRPITALAHHGVQTTALIVRANLRAALAETADVLAQQGFAPIRARWLARAYGLGESVRAQIGAETIAGRAVDLSADGALAIQTPDGRVRSISAGEVYFT